MPFRTAAGPSEFLTFSRHRAALRFVVAPALFALAACNDATAPNGGAAAVLGRRLIAGEQVACALDNAGKVFCWGSNTSFWEYGAPPGVLPGGISPTAAIAPNLSSLARGVGTHYCGINSAKEAVCWARDGSGQLGRGFVAVSGNTAALVTGGFHWAELSVGRLTTCGISDVGIGYCWGLNQYGTVGTSRIPVNAFVHTPSPVDGGLLFKSISAGWLHSCGITTAGAAYCWGHNVSGQVGIGVSDSTAVTVPTLVSGGLTFDQVSLGSRYSCGLTTAGDAYCWGENGTGQLGDGTVIAKNVPTLVLGGRKYTQIVTSSGFGTGSAGPLPFTGSQVGNYGHTCALATDARAYCWGWNGSGELGDGTQIDRSVPTAVTGGLTFSTIAAGGAFTCGMLDSRVWCWGSNLLGQIGSGDGDQVMLAPRAVDKPFRP